jgi:uncharacterized protein
MELVYGLGRLAGLPMTRGWRGEAQGPRTKNHEPRTEDEEPRTMNLEEKLRQLRKAAQATERHRELARQLEYLRRLEQRPKMLPAQRVAKSIEEYVEGQVKRNSAGEFFLARQALPFGRPYGRLRIGDVSTADLSPLGLFFEGTVLLESSRLVYLDTETTGLAGGTGTCAFLIGIGASENSQFVVRQFFLRDYPEEKAALSALAEVLSDYEGIVTFNGKTFDVPLLETRYALSRLKSPFSGRLHLDLLHPARLVWKLRLESCQLTNLEKQILGITRQGDVPGSEIPGIYFDYLRTGNPRGLQPVFYHNALDIVTLAALTSQMARAIADGGVETLKSSLDLFGLSRLFERFGAVDQSISACQRALAAGLPRSMESRALWHLASQRKRQRQYEQAAQLWMELLRRETEDRAEEQLTIQVLEELAVYHEHRRRDIKAAIQFAEAALQLLGNSTDESLPGTYDNLRRLRRFTYRMTRLQRKSVRASELPLAPSQTGPSVS